MKQLSQLKELPELTPIFAVLDSTLLDLNNQQFINDTQGLIQQVGFAPIYGLYFQEINHIIFNQQGEQLQTDDEKPSYTVFCESGLGLSLGSTIHMIHWDSIVGHQPLPVNIDNNPNPTLMIKIIVANNDMVSNFILPEPKTFLMLDTIMHGFSKYDVNQQNNIEN